MISNQESQNILNAEARKGFAEARGGKELFLIGILSRFLSLVSSARLCATFAFSAFKMFLTFVVNPSLKQGHHLLIP